VFKFTRVLSLALAFALVGGPLMMAPVSAQSSATQGTTTVMGVATDATGAPLPGVVVTLRGAMTYSAVSAENGAYSIPNVRAGVYTLSATKGGYGAANEQDYPIVAGVTAAINIRLEAATLSSITREIGRVSTVSSRSQFNSTPASVNIVSQGAILDQGNPQVQRVLDQTPGIVIDHPGTSATNAAAGAITFPSIRGGTGYETASLIDGHPLAVGNFGDYVTTFLDANVLQSVELIKGPGAAAPEVNYAIGGTVNFRTLDPTAKPSGSFKISSDSFGGISSNFNYSGTTANHRFGWVLDYAINGTPGPLKDAQGIVNIPSTSAVGVGATGFRYNCPPGANIATCQQAQGFNTNSIATNTPPGSLFQNNPNFGTATIEGLGFPVNQNYNSKTELVKFKYNLSDTTTATASFLGSQTYTDQNGNHVDGFNQLFTPGAGYTGALAPGPVFTYQNVFFPANEWEINNEPIFQAEVRSSIKNDTILARFYAASINRLQYNSLQSPSQNDYESLNLFGTVLLCPAASPILVATGKCAATTAAGAPTVAPVNTAFNGQRVNIAEPGANAFFRSAEEDKLHGGSFEYDHFIGNTGNTLSFSVDRTGANTFAYDFSGSGNTPSVAAGSSQVFTTYLVRGIFNVTPKLSATVSNYVDTYAQHFTPDGGKTFGNVNYSRDDARIGLTYRENLDTSFRFSAGSAIAPPFLNLLDKTATSPTIAAGGLSATQTIASGNLRPETSMGYDLGADFRLGKDKLTIISTDIYTTNLFNEFFSTTSGGAPAPACLSGNTLTDPNTCTNNTTHVTTAPTILPLFFTGQGNIGNTRYQGVEFKIARDPRIGIGGAFQGSLIRAYAYNISPCFYGTLVNNQLNCNTFAANTGVINGINFITSGTSGNPGSFTTVTNTSIPYSTAYAELHFRTFKGGLLSFGEQYYGNNNSLNVPAFLISNANARLPIGDGTQSLQFSIDNLFNTYGAAFATQAGGVQVPLVNGKDGLTNANVIGPRNARIIFTKRFGS
jgi:hypothetical protein